MKITTNGIKLCFDEKTLAFAIQKKDGCVWKWDESYAPCLECEEGTLFLQTPGRFATKSTTPARGDGILSTYRGFWGKAEGGIL